MENKVRNGQMAEYMFDLLGIKDVTKPWQKEKGTQVFELPFKTMYSGGYQEVNRFSVYESGYIRKMLVNSKGASWCCYQLNRTRSEDSYYKDYDLDGKWTGKYNRYTTRKCKLIPNEVDRLQYLLDYAIKNWYCKPQVQTKTVKEAYLQEVSVNIDGQKYVVQRHEQI